MTWCWGRMVPRLGRGFEKSRRRAGLNPWKQPESIELSQVWFTDPIYGLLKKPAADAFGPVLPAAPDPCHNPCDLPYLDESSQQKRHLGTVA